MEIELSKFKVRAGAHETANEWLAFLNKHMDEVLLTLKDEKMLVENIFQECVGEDMYLYWYSIQGTPDVQVEDSQHWVDQKHLEYWEKCIDRDFKPIDLTPVVSMIQPDLKADMASFL